MKDSNICTSIVLIFEILPIYIVHVHGSEDTCISIQLFELIWVRDWKLSSLFYMRCQLSEDCWWTQECFFLPTYQTGNKFSNGWYLVDMLGLDISCNWLVATCSNTEFTQISYCYDRLSKRLLRDAFVESVTMQVYCHGITFVQTMYCFR